MARVELQVIATHGHEVARRLYGREGIGCARGYWGWSKAWESDVESMRCRGVETSSIHGRYQHVSTTALRDPIFKSLTLKKNN